MGISRRDLFKLTGVGLAGAALGGAGEVLGNLAPRVQPRRISGLPLRPVASCCGGCPAGCGVVGWVDDDARLVRITGNPEDPNAQGHLCPRGIAATNGVQDPDRLLRPLKRSGPRGSGRFVEASWEEALAALGGRIGELARSKAGNGLALYGNHDVVAGLAAERLAAAAGSPQAWHPRSPEPANLAAALRLFWGVPGVLPDLERAKLALLFGANLHETHPWWMRPAAARWVVFDPRCSATAGAPGCTWRPIPPGTDGLVALAMAHVLLAEGLHDARFLARWTDVREDELRGHLAAYPPERVEEQTGLPASEVTAIARALAAEPASTVVIGEGAVAHAHGVETARAILLLAALAGRVEVAGGLLLPLQVPVAAPRPGPAPAKRTAQALFGGTPAVPEEPLAQLATAASSVRLELLLIWGGDPVWGEAQGQAVAGLLADEQRVGLLAVAATTLHETARLADWVLPAAPWPESWGLAAPPARSGLPAVLLRRPLQRPAGEARCPLDILLALGRATGSPVAEHFPAADAAAFCETTLHQADRLRDAGGLEHLLRRGLWVDRAAARTPGFGESFLPATDSEKLELKAAGPGCKRALPGWNGDAPGAAAPCAQVGGGGGDGAAGQAGGRNGGGNAGQGGSGGSGQAEARAGSPPSTEEPGTLWLVAHRSPLLDAPEDATAKWLSELHRGSRVALAPATARALDIEDGDPVTVRSGAGMLEGIAFLSEGIHPAVVAVARGAGHQAGSRVALGRPFRSRDPDTRRIGWGAAGVGDNPAHVVLAAVDPLGGGQAWSGTRVTVTRGGRGDRR